MTSRQSWRWDVFFFIAIVTTGYLVGSAFAHALEGLVVALLFHSAIYFFDLLRMQRWIESSEPLSPFRAGIWGDISDALSSKRKRDIRMIDHLQERVELLQASYSALPDAVVVIDETHCIQWCNRPAEQLLGLRYPKDTGLPLCDLVRVAELEAYLDQNEFDEALEIQSPRAQSIPLEVRVGRFGDASKVVFFRNIESYKRLESMRQDFVSSMSHEMRTPLTVIAGYLDTLDSILSSDSPMVERVLSQMRGQTRRMEHLLHDLMLLSKLEVGGSVGSDSEEMVILCALLESIVENANTASDNKRNITLDCGTVTGSYLARRVELESIFSNLIFNAVKYTHEGGNISVRLEALGTGELLFEVVDDGIGIDPEHIPHLTERFYRADKSRSVERGGSGLGLAIVKHALRNLNGRLEIDSYPDQGSTFSCYLPLERYTDALSA